MKKAKWLSEEALQMAQKRREEKGKGEKKRQTHLNAEFQRIARKDKKGFLTDQCKETEDPRVLEIRAKLNKCDLIKLKSFCTTKETISKVKRQIHLNLF